MKKKFLVVGVLVSFVFPLRNLFAEIFDVESIPLKGAGDTLSIDELNAVVGTIRNISNDNSTGYIGIGTTVPSQKLSIVDGSINIKRVTSPATGFGIAIEDVLDSVKWTLAYNPNFNSFRISEGGVATRLAIMNGSGNIGIGTESPTEKLEVNGSVKAVGFLYSSDVRLKKEIKTIENSLKKIEALRGVSFKWKSNEESELGFIAQEVETVFPDLVVTSDKDGLKSVKYGNLTAPIVESIKALSLKNKKLENEIEFLKKEIEEIKSTFNNK